MSSADTTRDLLNETMRIVHKGTKRGGQGVTAEEYRTYQRNAEKLRQSVNQLSVKRAMGTITPAEDALLDRLIRTQERWGNHGGKRLFVNDKDGKERSEDKEKGEQGDGQGKNGDGQEKSGWRSPKPEPTALDVPFLNDWFDYAYDSGRAFGSDVAAYFGHGPYGNKGDRITTIVGDYRKRRRREKGSLFSKLAKGLAERLAKRKTDGATGRNPNRATDGTTDGFPAAYGGGTPSRDDGMDPSERAAWERKRYFEEDAPVDGAYTRWMDEVQRKMQLAREGDEAMREWEANEYPKEAALWYRRMTGDREQVAADTRDAYSVDRDRAETKSKDSVASVIVHRGRQLGKALRNFADVMFLGKDSLASSIYGKYQKAKVKDEVWVGDYRREAGGRQIRVRGHRRRVWKNAPKTN